MPANHSHVGWVPREFLERPTTIQKGIGSLHEKVSTSSKQAQLFYDQGLTYLHSYVWIEAARSFHQALRLDAKMGMAYVGLSYAYSPIDFAAANEALGKAEAMANGLSEREQQRVKIRRLQLTAMLHSENKAEYLAFRAALDDGITQYPNDTEFLLLRGNAQEPTPFGDGQGCMSDAIPFYEKALKLEPGNFAAEHFLTHCYENSGHPEDSLSYAAEYVRLAPMIPHAHHMYGHVLRRTNGMQQAIEQFKMADMLERNYFRQNNFPPAIDWHHAHNLSLLASSFQYLGQMKEAERIYRQVVALPAHSDYDAFNRKDWPEFLLDRGRYQEALTAAQAMSKGPSPLARAAGYSLAGSALLAMNKQNEAKLKLQQADKEVLALLAADKGSVRTYTETLRGQLLLLEGGRDEALVILQKVSTRIAAANGPDAWIQGVYQLERIAEGARKAGDWDLAEQFTRLLIDRAGDYPGSHFAMAIVLKHQGDAEAARIEFSRAVTGWAQADADLSEMREIRRMGAESAVHGEN
jgi:tetratricopeptide (TPR) repeat protein